jgi:hydrogenase maturation protease
MWRIIGIGSPWGDDQAGWRVVELLQGETPRAAGHWEALICSHPAVELAGQLRGAGAAVLVDAQRTGVLPGTVCRYQGKSALARAETLSSHGLGVAEILRLIRAVESLPDPLIIYGIEAATLSPTDPLSPAVAAALPALRDRILAEVTTGKVVTSSAKAERHPS